MPGYSPSFVKESLWHTPHASTRILTWPGPGCGTSRSTISRSPPAFDTCATFIFAIASSSVLDRLVRLGDGQSADRCRHLGHETPVRGTALRFSARKTPESHWRILAQSFGQGARRPG